jgi:4-azaleucine resistance transporter AzlC
MSSPRSEFLSGVRDELPILLGVIPFGMIYGALAVGAGLPPNAALAMSSIVFAGSSQFIATQLIGGGTPGIVVVLTAFVVNLRHVLYSASVAPYVKPLRPVWKWVLAYLLTDEAYAVTIAHYHKDADPARKHWYFLGAGLTLWASWQASTAAGVVLRTQVEVPASWALDFTLALTFIAIVVPALKDRASVAAALSAGAVAVAAAALPYKLGLMLAALTGIVVGVAIENGGVARDK